MGWEEEVEEVEVEVVEEVEEVDELLVEDGNVLVYV